MTHSFLRALKSALTLSALSLVACASRSAEIHTERLPDNVFKLTCETAPLTRCLARADDVCHGNPYEVLSARDQRNHYGQRETGDNEVETRSSEATIHCGKQNEPPPHMAGYEEHPDAFRLRRADAPPTENGDGGASETHPAAVATGAPAPATPPPAARACIPGSTQACVGPGKCEGGQSCLPDGTAYGPCDCGTLSAPSPSPASPPKPAATKPSPKSAPAKTP